MNKRRLIVANWKMYISTPEEAKKFATALRRKARVFAGVDAVLAPSFTLLPLVSLALKDSSIKTSAQSISVFETGAHTGEVGAKMVKNFGASYSIVGHSERRAQGETDTMVCAQLGHAAVAGITPILCIGESERDAAGAYLGVVAGQLREALKSFPASKTGAKTSAVPKLVIAYEPVWTIGKSANEAMKPSDVREMSIFIKKTLAEHFERTAALRVPILYGGSVEPSNVAALIEEGDINGFLVGHASITVDSFVEILQACK
ncbi:MAG: triose-phosphate isomerase [Minisyncoccia bacterium]|jgi:triosephosphate isomerase